MVSNHRRSWISAMPETYIQVIADAPHKREDPAITPTCNIASLTLLANTISLRVS